MRTVSLTRRFSVLFIVVHISLATLVLLARAKGGHPQPAKLARKTYSQKLKPYKPKKYPDHGTVDKLSELGKNARGFYLTPYWLYKIGAKTTARLMKAAHLNAVVFDLKDDWGNVLWPSKVPLSKSVQKVLIRDPKAVIKAFHDEGIYVIGRMVSFKDSKMPYARPDLAVRFKPGKRLFWAGAGWIDAYSPEVRDYLIDLALEWQGFGIDEIQLDYIRFPKGRSADWGIWLHQVNDKRNRDVLVASFLERLDRALKVPLSVDVYGLTTLVDGDPRHLGQTIEKMAQHVEAISPMMYANGMTSYFRGNKITPRVYGIIQCGLWRARQKAPHIALRPYLQAYPDNVPFFGTDFIIKQLEGAQRAGSNGFLFWNSSMRNGVAFRALKQMGKKRLADFGDKPEQYKENDPGPWCKRPGGGNVFERTKTKKQTLPKDAPDKASTAKKNVKKADAKKADTKPPARAAPK